MINSVLFAGMVVVLQAVVLGDLIGVDKLAVAFGMSNAVSCVSFVLGPTIAGEHNESKGVNTESR